MFEPSFTQPCDVFDRKICGHHRVSQQFDHSLQLTGLARNRYIDRIVVRRDFQAATELLRYVFPRRRIRKQRITKQSHRAGFPSQIERGATLNSELEKNVCVAGPGEKKNRQAI